MSEVQEYKIPSLAEQDSRDQEQERTSVVESLSKSADELIRVELARHDEEFSPDAPSVSVLVRKDIDAREANRWDLDLAEPHAFERHVGEDGVVSYKMVQLGAAGSKLGREVRIPEYQWKEGGGEVQRGYVKDYAGDGSVSTEYSEPPTTLSLEEMRTFNELLEDLKPTAEQEDAPVGRLAKVRAGLVGAAKKLLP